MWACWGGSPGASGLVGRAPRVRTAQRGQAEALGRLLGQLGVLPGGVCGAA